MALITPHLQASLDVSPISGTKKIAITLSELSSPAKIELFPLTPAITVRAVNLYPIHKDPFDRLIIATALEYGAKLASVDSLFSKYPELESYLM